MKRIYVCLILSCCLANLAYGQENQDHLRAYALMKTRIGQITSSGSECSDGASGNIREYSARVYMVMRNGNNFDQRYYVSDCQQCNDSGSCTYGEGAPIDNHTVREYPYFAEPTNGLKYNLDDWFGASIWAWENDRGGRCTYEGNGGVLENDDDCESNRNNYSSVIYKTYLPSNQYRSTGLFDRSNHDFSVEYTWKYVNYDGSSTIPGLFDISCAGASLAATAGRIDAWVLNLAGGVTYEFETTAGGNTALTLFRADGVSQAAYDDNSGNGLLSKLSYTPPQDGTYFIEVSESGRNRLSLHTDLSYRIIPPAANPILTASTTRVCAGNTVTLNLSSNPVPALFSGSRIQQQEFQNSSSWATLATNTNTFAWNSAQQTGNGQNVAYLRGSIEAPNGPFQNFCAVYSPTISIYILEARPRIVYGAEPIICTGESFDMSAVFDGLQYGCSIQWQISSQGAGGPWSDIPGKTNPGFNTGPLTATRWYRVRPICPGDGCSQVFSAVREVTVKAPTITCPSNFVNSSEASKCGRTLNMPGPQYDQSCFNFTLTQTSGLSGVAFFPVGTTTNTYVLTDNFGNTATCSHTITIVDNTPLELHCADDSWTIDANPGSCTIESSDIEFLKAIAYDNCGTPTISGPFPAGPYGVGVHNITWTAESVNGETATCSHTVTVRDDEKPECTSLDIAVDNDPGECGAVVNYDITATDNCELKSVVLTLGRPSGSLFPVGTERVYYLATDMSDNAIQCSFNVWVKDVEPPKFDACPASFSVDIDSETGQCGVGTIVTYDVSPSDNCSLTSSGKSYGIDSGELFPLGATPNVFYAYDGRTGVYVFCEFTVTVNDCTVACNLGNNAPSISGCPSNISVGTDAGTCQAVVTWTSPTASDYCDETLLPQGSHAPGDVFAEGETTVTYTATDAAGNHATPCSFTVTVSDDEAPVFSGCPANISVGTEAGTCQAVVTWTLPTAGDNCDNALTPQSSYASGDVFPEGGTMVTYTATDAAGNNAAPCSFTVTVSDDKAPIISGCPANISVGTEAGTCQAVVSWTPPTAGDNCDGALVPQGSHASGDVFTKGETTVTYTAMDAAGNKAVPCSFTVTVSDYEAPVISDCPANISVGTEAGTCQAVVTWTPPTASDNCDALTPQSSYASGDVFPEGETTVSYSALDAAANKAVPCSFTVTVSDHEAPVISGCPANISVGTDAGVCQAVVSWTPPTAGDNCVALTPQSSYASGDVFPKGETTVTYTATDAAGNNAVPCSFTVTVSDDKGPVFSGCPANISVGTDAGTCQAVIGWTPPTAGDNCDGNLVPLGSYASGDVFPEGETTVTYTATDAVGNKAALCSFTVTVSDHEAPVISGCPANISVGTDAGTCQAVVSWTPPTASDNCDALTPHSSYASGDVFPEGETTVIYSALDAAANKAVPCSFTVTVSDHEAPIISGCPSNISVGTDAGICQAVVNWILPTASDNCDALTPQSSYASGDVFPKGETTVFYSALDAAGNKAVPCSFTVTVSDHEAPVISGCPSNISVGTDAGTCQAVVSWTPPTASDNCDALTPQSTYASGDVFPKGETTVSYSALDAAGNKAVPCSFTVTVSDDEGPVFSGCPANISVGTDAGVCQAVVGWTPPTAGDNCDGNLVPQGSYASGDVFPEGETTVTYTATDAVGNKAVPCSFTVTVSDHEAPVISGCPSNISVGTDAGTCQAVVSWIPPTAGDNCDGVLTPQGSHSSGNVFAEGETTVTYTATDAAGNSATQCSFTVTVSDDEAPKVTCPPNITASADAGSCNATISIGTATATDNCGVKNIDGVRSDGAALTDTYPFGTTTIIWTATDVNGNTSLPCTQTIEVNRIGTVSSVTVTPGTKQYSDLVTFRATLSPGGCGAKQAAQTVTFKVGTQVVGTVSLNVAGGDLVGTLTAPLLEVPTQPSNGLMAPGVHIVTAVFGGVDPAFAVTDPTTNLTITQEDAIVAYTGQSLQATPSSNSSSATVILSANIQDIADLSSGDIRNARVKFVNRDNNNSDISGWIPVSNLVNPGDTRTGTVSWPLEVTLGNNETSESITVGVIVDNGYYIRNSSDDNTVITVYKPEGDFVTGGGYIVPNSSAGQYASGPGLKTNFGFNVKYNKKGTQLKGQMNVIFRRMESDGLHVYQIKGNAIQSLGVDVTDPDNQTAVFITKSNLTDITDPNNTISLGGNLLLTVTMTDAGEPGHNDQIAITLTNSSNTLLYSSNWTGINTSKIFLAGGNLVIKSGFSFGNEEGSLAAIPDEFPRTIAPQMLNPAGVDFTLYPNPARYEINIGLESFQGQTVELAIYDKLGRHVRSVRIDEVEFPTQRIDVEQLAYGTYLLQLRTETGVLTRKFVILE